MINFILHRNGQAARNWLAGFTLAGALSSSVAFSDWEQSCFFFSSKKQDSRTWRASDTRCSASEAAWFQKEYKNN